MKASTVAAVALGLGTSCVPVAAGAQTTGEVIRLYPAAAPGIASAIRPEVAYPLTDPRFTPPNPDTLVVNVSVPTLTVFAPPPGKANGAAIVIAPGGGFRVLSYKNEGERVAQRLAAQGITAFVLKYRLHQIPAGSVQEVMGGLEAMMKAATARPAPDAAAGGRPPIPIGPVEQGAIADGQAAIRLIRSRAAAWKLDPHKVGMIGFSAGGVVAGGAAVGTDATSRPNYVGIVYSFTPGPIPRGAPPAFMAAAADDPLSAGMPDLFSRWRAAGASAELHIYAKGQHGFGTAVQGLPVDHWMDGFGAWLAQQGFVPADATTRQ